MTTMTVALLVLLPGLCWGTVEGKRAQAEQISVCSGSENFIWVVFLGRVREISNSTVCHSFEDQLKVQRFLQLYLGVPCSVRGQHTCALYYCWVSTCVGVAQWTVKAACYQVSLPVEGHSRILGLNVER